MKNKPTVPKDIPAEDLNHILSYVLVVDDDADDHQLLREAIGKNIPETIVESVYDGDEALKYLSTCSEVPDLIVLDINMPRLNGADTLSLIRENKHLKNIPVAVFTVSTSPEHRQLMLEKGANAFYSKPAGRREIEQIVCDLRDQFLWTKSGR